VNAPAGGGTTGVGTTGGGTVLAYAKLTLSLRVSGVRPDGYHLIDAEMVTVDLADTLHFSPGDGLEVEDAAAGSGGYGEVPADASNLVVRALAMVGRRSHVRLVKRIPAGAGLGGGSADAAAVLRWAWATGPLGTGSLGTGPRGTGPRGTDMAAKLGADVPFCLAGGGHARVTGAGEILAPLPFAEVAGRAYTLLVPPFGVSTAAVYKAWDAMGGPRSANANDLEPAALVVEPRLAAWRDRLHDATGARPALAGSGSTWFVAGAYPGDGRVVVRVARN